MDRKRVRASALARLKIRIAELERGVSSFSSPASGGGKETPESVLLLWPGVAAGRGVLHEMRASDWRDMPAALGFALAVAARLSETRGALVFIERKAAARDGLLSGRGLAAFGLDPSRALFVRARTEMDALFAAEEAARAKDVAAALLILKGKTKRLTLTATRRLHLAAGRSGATPMIVRTHTPSEATAATMRWRIEGRPSAAIACDSKAPGSPRWRVAVDKAASACRLAVGEASFLVEWRHDERRFVLPEAEEGAAGSRAHFPAAFRRSLSPADEAGRLVAARAS